MAVNRIHCLSQAYKALSWKIVLNQSKWFAQGLGIERVSSLLPKGDLPGFLYLFLKHCTWLVSLRWYFQHLDESEGAKTGVTHHFHSFYKWAVPTSDGKNICPALNSFFFLFLLWIFCCIPRNIIALDRFALNKGAHLSACSQGAVFISVALTFHMFSTASENTSFSCFLPIKL